MGRWPSAALIQKEYVVLLYLVGWLLALSSHIRLYPRARLVVWGRWPSATLNPNLNPNLALIELKQNSQQTLNISIYIYINYT